MILDTIRLRLTAWHILTIALLLSAFAAGTWIFLVRSARAGEDSSLASISRAFVDGWRAERAEHALSPATAASDAAAEFRYRDKRIVVFDNSGRTVAMSDTVPLAPALATIGRLSRGVRLAEWAARASLAGEGAFATLQAGAEDDTQVRAHAARITLADEPFTVVVLGSLHAERETAEAFVGALSIIIPIVLVLAGLGGYLLARASLAPVVAMARQAERTSALNLHERIPVGNPRDELGRLATVLNGLLDRLQRAFEQQQRAAEQQRNFMADASHELRTPVTAIRSTAEVALSRTDRTPEELVDALDVVRGEGVRLGRVVDDLFLLSRADAGDVPVRSELVYLEEVIQDCARAARAMATSRSIALDAPVADEAPFVGDPQLLRRLVMILLDNAIKYTPSGGEVRVRLQRTPLVPHAYQISVEDSGPGVPAEARERIFERFFRFGHGSHAGASGECGVYRNRRARSWRGRPGPRHRAVDCRCPRRHRSVGHCSGGRITLCSFAASGRTLATFRVDPAVNIAGLPFAHRIRCQRAERADADRRCSTKTDRVATLRFRRIQMPGMNTLRTNQRLRQALIVAVGLLVSAGVGAVALAQNERQDKTPYRSSIQVPKDSDENEADEADEADEATEGREAKESDDERGSAGAEAEDAAEKAESARYQSLARITSAQAAAAAISKVPGTVIAAVLENEDGNLVYGVEIRTTAGEQDVKVDAGNGAVLHVEKGDRD